MLREEAVLKEAIEQSLLEAHAAEVDGGSEAAPEHFRTASVFAEFQARSISKKKGWVPNPVEIMCRLNLPQQRPSGD